MAYTLGNKYAQNLCKRTVLLQLIINNVVTCFFGTQCIYCRIVQRNAPTARLYQCACVLRISRHGFLFHLSGSK